MRVVAAGLAGRNAAVEAVDTLGGEQGRQALGIGMDRADAQAVALFGARPDLVGLGEEPAGVDGRDVDGEARFGDEVGDHLILEAEARGEDDASVDGRARRRKDGGRVPRIDLGEAVEKGGAHDAAPCPARKARRRSRMLAPAP